MCCTTTIGGEFSGIRHNTSLIASTPPVDAPIAINFLFTYFPKGNATVVIGLAALLLLCDIPLTLAVAAAFIFVINSCLSADKLSLFWFSLGLLT
jgi:hypothetical protein